MTENTNSPSQSFASGPDEGPSSWGGTLLALGLFLISGLYVLTLTILTDAPLMMGAGSTLFWLDLVLPSAALALGWIRGFPRWAYPFAGMALVTSMSMASATTPGLKFFGYVFGRSDPWGWRAFVPLFLAILSAAVVTRSWDSFFHAIDNVDKDLSLFTFTLYGTLPLLMFVNFGEVDRTLSLKWGVVIILLLLISVMAYLRGSNRFFRAGALLAGTLPIFAINAIVPVIYWSENGGVSLPLTILYTLITALVFGGPAVLSVTKQRERKAI